ncbi:phage tail tip lysozyme, partial [Bacillus cereus]|nr:phage tail tip lysozyme [Bacillus cereus]
NLHVTYQVSVDAIRKANPAIDEDNLPIGEELIIPNVRGGDGPTPTPEPTPNDDNLAIAWNFFKKLGFLNGATAGIMGNLQHESHMDPRRKQDNGGPGRGICQWETNRGGSGRWEKLVEWATENNKEVYALNTQLEFLYYELKEGDIETVKRLRKYGGVKGLKMLGIEDAVRVFQECFERARIPDYPSRRNYAYEIYKRFAR